jgi:hypothetical protein
MRPRQPLAGVRIERPQGAAGLRPGAAPPPQLTPLPGRDPGLGHIFCNMRSALRLPRDAIARRLATNTSVIEDLETGAVSSLPHWPETVRIVRAYCELLRLDPEPLLWRLQQLARQGVKEEAPPARSTGSPPPLLPRNSLTRDPVSAARSRPRSSGGGGGLRKLMMLGTLPALAAGLAYMTVVAPSAGYRVVSLLPAPLAEPARNGLDTIVVYSAPRRDGLKWIDVGDPRLRKGDKLQTKR